MKVRSADRPIAGSRGPRCAFVTPPSDPRPRCRQPSCASGQASTSATARRAARVPRPMAARSRPRSGRARRDRAPSPAGARRRSATASPRSPPRPCRFASPRASSGPVRPTPRPSTSAAAKFARPIDRAGREPAPAAAASRRRSAGRTGPDPAGPPSRPAPACSGGGSSSSSARTGPTTNSTGPSTRDRRLFARRRTPASAGSSRRAQPMSSRCARRPSASAATAARADRPLAHEDAAEPPGQPLGRRRLLEEDPDEVAAGPAALPAEDRLVAVVVAGARSSRNSPSVTVQPVRARAASLTSASVIVADAQGEQLHQLAGEVLVGVPLAVGRGVEPDQQGRVADDGVEQLAERRPGQPAEGLVLPAHRRRGRRP